MKICRTAIDETIDICYTTKNKKERDYMPINEKEYNGNLMDQLTLLERIERVAKRTEDNEVLEEIEIIRKEVNRKLYQPPQITE